MVFSQRAFLSILTSTDSIDPIKPPVIYVFPERIVFPFIISRLLWLVISMGDLPILIFLLI